MIVVIDTSVGAEIVMQRQNAKRYAGHMEASDWVVAPNLYVCEITNVFWKYHLFEDLPLKTCMDYIENAVMLPDEYIQETGLYRESFAMACHTRMPVYDMLFLVLARRYNASLASMDKKLKDCAAKHSINIL